MNSNVGRLFIALGIVSIIIGLIFLFNLKIPLGKLPGDIIIKNKNSTFYFPLATSIIVSVVLSLIMWIISKF